MTAAAAVHQQSPLTAAMAIADASAARKRRAAAKAKAPEGEIATG